LYFNKLGRTVRTKTAHVKQVICLFRKDPKFFLAAQPDRPRDAAQAAFSRAADGDYSDEGELAKL